MRQSYDRHEERYAVYVGTGSQGNGQGEDDGPETGPMERSATPTDDALHVAVLEERLRANEQAYRALEERLRDTETVRDRLMEQNERLTLLLTAPQPEQPTPEPMPRTWWQRLIGGKG